MKLKKFLLQSNNIARDSFVWNMAGSMIMAFQSVILLMIITRTAGLAEAGIFTIANVNANLFLNIGKYGMRNYQVSDVEGQFSFGDYLQQVRIERAKELLLNSSDSVTEIAFSSGYNDIYYFNRVFRKAVNCSPMEFRKNRGRTGG